MRPSGCCAPPRTDSARPTRSGSSRWPRRACSRWPTRPARSSPITAGRRRAASWRRPSRAAGRCSSRSRRSSARAPTARPSRKASGVDPNRLSLLIAVLGRRAGVALGSHDVYANLAGGLSVAEPALDLPLALALASSHPRPAHRAGNGRHRRGRAARRAAGGRRPRAPAARGRPARLPDRDRAGVADGSAHRPDRRPRGRPRRAPCAMPSRRHCPTGRSLVARRSPRC